MAKYTVTVTRTSTYEVEATDREAAESVALGAYGMHRQTEALVDEDTIRVDTERALRDCDIAQVVFEHASGTVSSPYAYEVPEGLDYRVGDLVVVPPAGYRRQPDIARVVAVGRGKYTGPLKTLIGKVITPDTPVEDDPEPDDDYTDRGFGNCPDCGIAYGAEDWSPCGGTMS